ncbi:hypothetical protein ACFVAJ_16900 [Agromyces sp. NPDC057679]|uniref:hypothetical protein n=1 Tax=Agromyces sp. NPDC057679 TaxID=3346207 RepID=UPI00366E05C6
MASVITDEIAPPARTDGTSWPYVLNTNDHAVYADSVTEIVAALIEGYADVEDSYRGDVDAWMRRVVAAGELAEKAQAQAIAAVELFDLAAASEDVATALLAPRGVATNQFAGNWGGPVPLILVSTDYAPYTDVPLPTGDVTFLDPTNEQTFVNSYAELHGYEFHALPG